MRPSADHPVRLPGLAVVGEVGRDDPLQLHPEVAVVVLDHEAGGGGAGDDRAAPSGDEDRRAERLAAGMLEDDLRVPAHEATDVLAQPAPLLLVLGVLVGPELVARGLAVDDGLDAELVEQVDLVRRGHHADRRATAVEHVLAGVAAEAAGRAPDQDGVALAHRGRIGAAEHPVAGRVAQGVDRGLLPAQVRGLRHQLVGPDHREVGQAAEVRLEAPDALVGGQHGVVVGAGVLVVDIVAVHGDPITRLPVAHGRARLQHHAGRVGTDHVVRQRVAGPPGALLAEAVEEEEGRQGLEDRRPDRVEVDRAGHDGHVGLVGGQLGGGHVVDVEGLAGVLVPGLDAGEHLGVLAAHERRPVGLGDGQGGDVLAGCAPLDGVEDLLHGRGR